MINTVPDWKKSRVIINTDAKNEVDDQYAIVQGVLTPSFDLLGIIPAHFGEKRSKTSMRESHDEVMLLLKLLGREKSIRVEDGAERAIQDEHTPRESAGARLIIEEAMKDDERPLHIAFLGPLTDMASAILMEPSISARNVRVIWIGGGAWPAGGPEYNLENDVSSANVVFRSGIEVWQIPRNVYRMMPVTHAELIERVYPMGPLGEYLTMQLIEFNHDPSWPKRPTEFRVLGDSPAIGVIIYPDCGISSMKAAPEIDEKMNYIHSGKYGLIRVYQTIDPRFIMEDFYAKLSQFFLNRPA